MTDEAPTLPAPPRPLEADGILRAGDALNVVEEEIRALVLSLVEGTAEDVAVFTSRISAQYLMAAQLGREDLLEVLRGNLSMLGEASRLRASDAAWRALDVSLRALTQGLVRVVANVAAKAVVTLA